MKAGAVQGLWLLLLGLLLAGLSGCETSEPDNASVRPWNSPQGYGGGMPIMNQQHE